MKLSHYLKDKVIPLIIIAAALALLALALRAFGLSAGVIVVLCCLLAIAIAAAFTWDFLKRRRFFNTLIDARSKNDETYYLSELIERPQFVEGQTIYDTLKQANKDMNDHIAQYRRASEGYREYIETWIHEVKTPIAAARLTLANNADDSLAPLVQDLDHIDSYVEQALYYSRSTSIEKDYLIKAVNLDSLVKGVVKKNARTLIDHGVTPTFDGLDQTVYADSKWLDFIIGQIVANSVKYAQPDASTHTIAFTAQRMSEGFDNETVLLSIGDDGIGIPASDLDRVFEKGFTGENGRRYAKSTGIGLYLCRKLCTKMKLSISLDSTPGKGTTVTIQFPLSKMYFLE